MVLPAPLKPNTTTREPRSIAKSTPANTSREPYILVSPVAFNGVFPHGEGSGKVICATRSAIRTSSSSPMSLSARATICFAAAAFVAFAPNFAACLRNALAFFSALARSRRRRASSVARASWYCAQPMLYTSASPRTASRNQTLLHTASRSSTSWEIMIKPPSCLDRKSRSQVMESASRWLVGSSRSSVVVDLPEPPEAENKIRASSTRRRWPPESVESCWSKMRAGSPRASQIRAASEDASYPPSWWYCSSNREYFLIAASRLRSSVVVSITSC